ncbi:MAG: hypothetical protein IKM53_06470 [Clostridia bacterium]|nr:hypothetical protein [Clostridia bacterium]
MPFSEETDGYGRLINSSLMNSSEDAVQFCAENLYDSYAYLRFLMKKSSL